MKNFQNLSRKIGEKTWYLKIETSFLYWLEIKAKKLVLLMIAILTTSLSNSFISSFTKIAMLLFWLFGIIGLAINGAKSRNREIVVGFCKVMKSHDQSRDGSNLI